MPQCRQVAETGLTRQAVSLRSRSRLCSASGERSCLPTAPAECLQHTCICICISRPQLDGQVRTGSASPPFKGVWHKCRLLNYPWVDARPAKHLGATTSLIGEYLFYSLEIQCSAFHMQPSETQPYCLRGSLLLALKTFHNSECVRALGLAHGVQAMHVAVVTMIIYICLLLGAGDECGK